MDAAKRPDTKGYGRGTDCRCVQRERRFLLGAGIIAALLVLLAVLAASDDSEAPPAPFWTRQGYQSLARGQHFGMAVPGTNPFQLVAEVEREGGPGPDMVVYSADEYEILASGGAGEPNGGCVWRGIRSVHSHCELWIGSWVVVFEMKPAPSYPGSGGTFLYHVSAYRSNYPFD